MVGGGELKKFLLFLICLLPILGHAQSQIDQFQILQLGYNASPGNPSAFTGYVYINNSGQLVCILHDGTSCLTGGGGSGTIIASPSPDCLPYYQGANTTLTPDCALVTDTAGGLTLVKLTVSGSTTGVITLKTGSAPANPAATFGSLYIDSGTNNLTCLNSSGGSCLPTVNTSFSAITSGDNNTAVMTTDSGASLSPLNIGQVVGNQLWGVQGLVVPVIDSSQTGGNIGVAQLQTFAYTLNTASGETLGSVIQNSINGTSGCVSGTSCSFSMQAPTIPTGYTGYTAYWCDLSGGSGCAAPVKVLACVNIVTACSALTSQGLNSGVALPTLNAAWVTPPNNTANPTLVPGALPFVYLPSDDGNYRACGGMDFTGTVLPTPNGTFTWNCRFFISDSAVNIITGGASGPMRNNLVSINHLINGNTTSLTAADDRALGIKAVLPTSTTGASNPRPMGIYNETWIQGTPTQLGTGVDKGGVAGRFVLADNRSASTLAGSLLYALAGSYQNQPGSAGNFGSCAPCAVGVKGEMSLANTSVNFGGSLFSVFYSTMGTSAGNSGDQLIGYWAAGPNTAGHSGNIAYLIANGAGTWPTGTSDYAIRSDISGLQSILGGTLNLPAINSDSTTLTIGGSTNTTGGVKTTQMAAPTGSASCLVTGGSTQFQFQIVAVDANGGKISSAAIFSGNTCNADISGTNKVNLILTGASVGADHYDFYFINAGGGTCSGGACTLGKVGSCTPVFASSARTGLCSPSSPAVQYSGAAGDGTTAPTINTTGGIVAYNFGTLTNCAAVGSAASPSVAACAAASAGAFSCATNASAATCTINTTAVTASSEILVELNSSEGTRLSVTCATAANITVLPTVTLASKTAGTGFTINLPTFTTNPTCWNYTIIN